MCFIQNTLCPLNNCMKILTGTIKKEGALICSPRPAFGCSFASKMASQIHLEILSALNVPHHLRSETFSYIFVTLRAIFQILLNLFPMNGAGSCCLRKYELIKQ